MVHIEGDYPRLDMSLIWHKLKEMMLKLSFMSVKVPLETNGFVLRFVIHG
jgi:hypothetical protein